MSDLIIEQLLAACGHTAEAKAAADEIERLEADNKQLRKMNAVLANTFSDLQHRSDKEIERLRKLFTWIEEEYEEDTLAGDIARKALAGNNG
jgi:archaellum component FlaC